MLENACKLQITNKSSKLKLRSYFKIIFQHHFHGHDWESLHKVLDSSILPIELGGSLQLSEALDNSVLDSLMNSEKYYEGMFPFIGLLQLIIWCLKMLKLYAIFFSELESSGFD